MPNKTKKRPKPQRPKSYAGLPGFKVPNKTKKQPSGNNPGQAFDTGGIANKLCVKGDTTWTMTITTNDLQAIRLMEAIVKLKEKGYNPIIYGTLQSLVEGIMDDNWTRVEAAVKAARLSSVMTSDALAADDTDPLNWLDNILTRMEDVSNRMGVVLKYLDARTALQENGSQ